VCALAATVAIIFCWFGFDGARNAVAAGASLVAITGAAFLCYGLLSILLLISAWVERSPTAWRIVAGLSTASFVLMLIASVGADRFNRAEVLALIEVGVLMVVNVVSVRFVATHGA
jgi:hypothetical protein